MSRNSRTRGTKAPVSRAAIPEETIRKMYRILSRVWGEQHWWPAESAFEVIAGSILTQNTSWTNVDRALTNLRREGLINIDGIRRVPLAKLEQLIRSSGYFRQKAQRLKNFVGFLDAAHAGSLEQMFSTPAEQLRAELLTQKGIGPETADSILLYAGHCEVFVVDAYTRRILERHQVIAANTKYDDLRALVEGALREENLESLTNHALSPTRPIAHLPSPMSSAARTSMAQIYNEMHGLIVQVGKHYCRKQRPGCDTCPLGFMLTPSTKRKLMDGSDVAHETRRRPAKRS